MDALSAVAPAVSSAERHGGSLATGTWLWVSGESRPRRKCRPRRRESIEIDRYAWMCSDELDRERATGDDRMLEHRSAMNSIDS